ncbi:hypothetical protein [Pseudaminobacter sp. NGMCC 1.201702]|uniref:hypothetical protein n=1 Tax=Pseudaminobacter sp. NGMCC 1.201702 TaxID=3391825 RepID=UPI0039EFAD29
MIRAALCALPCLALVGCAASNAIRTSNDTAIIQARAAPVCGGVGAANVAQKQAAIETLKAGYDRYIIVEAASANDVRVTQMPGSYQTSGTYGGGFLNANTTYRPGPTIVSGGHSQSFAIKMFKDTDPGAGRAISARGALGPDWQALVKAGGAKTCT